MTRQLALAGQVATFRRKSILSGLERSERLYRRVLFRDSRPLTPALAQVQVYGLAPLNLLGILLT
jgi:hypothetical protein